MPVVAEELPKLRPGRVRVTCSDPELILEGFLGPESPRLTGGFGGWNVTNRPRQVGMVTYDGIEPFELQFGMIWDGILGPMRRRVRRTPHSVEPDIRKLLAVVRGDPESRPGIVSVDGIPSLPTDRWVIRNIEFGDAIRRDGDMSRIRLSMDFTLLEFVSPKFETALKRSVGRDLGKTVTMTTQDGDTPAKIARRRKCKWTDIRKLNPDKVKRANQKLRKGTKLRVPARKPRKDED